MLHVIISPGWAVVINEIWLWMQNRDCLGILVALLIKRVPFELEMIKRGSSACGSGVSIWPGSGSQQRWHHVIIRDRFWAGVKFADNRGRCGDTISTFHLSSLVKYPQVCGELAVFCVTVLSSLFPGHAAAAPLSLCGCWRRAEKSMHSHWEERNLVSDNLGRLVWIIHSSGGTQPLMPLLQH